MTNIHLTEDKGEYIQQWACEPPAEGAGYRVIEDKWDGVNLGLPTPEPPIRTIYKWEPVA